MKSLIRTLVGLALIFAPAPLLAQKKGKPTVAIYEMRDLAKTGQGETLSAMIETAITSTGKFRVIERKFDELVREQGSAATRMITTNHPGKIGGFEGADFLIYGTITTVSQKQSHNFGASLARQMLGGQNAPVQDCNNTTATLAIDIKITDSSSGEVRYNNRINESQTSTAACGSNGQIDTAALMRSAADRIATGLVTSIYPIQVAAAQPDGTIILNYGQGAILPGAIMAVYNKGSAIVDPATGDVIGNNETRLGYVKIDEVETRMSKATPFGPFAVAPPVGSIVRAISDAEQAALLKPAKHK